MKRNLPCILAILLLVSFSTTNLWAQEETKLDLAKCVRLEGGLIMGGQVINDNFLYSPGGSIKYTYCLKSGKKAGFGIGGGIEFFEKEGFIPFYFDFIGLMNKRKNAGFVNFQAGYAFGWNDKFQNFTNYEFKGGICFGVGVGKRFQVNERFSTYLSAAYRHQFATVTHTSYSSVESTDLMNYDMLVISLGIMLEQE